MNDLAISIEGISKQYRINPVRPGDRSLRDVASDLISAPLRYSQDRFDQRRRNGNSPSSNDNPAIWALRDVSFEVRRGEIVGIIGRNGAGKSTLLKVISRITKPTSGKVKIRGRVGSLLEVGTGFHPELSGRENIYLNGAILGMAKTEIVSKFDEIVAFAEIDKFLDTPVKRYSSGMYVRLAFAVAAHLEPEILLVDEVLAVGDLSFQKKCLGRMGNIASDGRTVLFVSHNMAAIRNLCTRAILLDRGNMVGEGTPDHVIDRYLEGGAAALEAMVVLPPSAANELGAARTLRFSSVEGIPMAQFRLGERWRVALEFDLFRPAPHVIGAVGLSTLDSIDIVTFWSEPRDLTPGSYVVEFDCDVPLKACELKFTVGLSTNERTFCFVRDVGRVSINEAAVGEQPIRASGAGLLLGQQGFQIKALDSEPKLRSQAQVKSTSEFS